jgi:hypothetical protein
VIGPANQNLLANLNRGIEIKQKIATRISRAAAKHCWLKFTCSLGAFTMVAVVPNLNRIRCVLWQGQPTTNAPKIL